MVTGSLFSVQCLAASEREEWQHFARTARGATIFHDLDFLAYHPKGRFKFRHLVFRDASHEIAAILPGGVVENRFISPLGASVGGLAVAKDLNTVSILAVAQSLARHAEDLGWAGVEMTLAPPLWHTPGSQVADFALHQAGFRLVHRSLSMMIPLLSDSVNQFEQSFAKRSRPNVRSGRRQGVTVAEYGAEALTEMAALIRDTYGRHGAHPTHSEDELAALMRQCPSQITIWLAISNGEAIAGTVVFKVTRDVALTFYICDRESERTKHGVSVILAEMTDNLGNKGYRFIDLGPSASDEHFNESVVRFKEGVGASGFCRDRWALEL